MASEVGICNAALALLGEPTITALDDAANANAIACNEAYERLRDAELRKHRWAFAIKRVQLAASATSPVHGKTNYFPVPADYIRLAPRDNKALEWYNDWAVENTGTEVAIATDDSAPLDIRYVAKITDTNQMDPLFREALSASIARHIARKVLNSNSLVQDMKEEHKEIVAIAKQVNSIEKPPQDYPEDPWITARL